jgi:beta-fructofuranosidase
MALHVRSQVNTDMPFIPADRYIWDFWIAPRDPGEPYHLFFLQAPRTIAHPDLRHKMATVGHAVSHDLRAWELLPTALEPGPAGAWDDQAIWTGSVFRHNDTYYFFYSALHSAGGWNQKIGLATSSDLVNWTRYGHNPILEADARWYEKDTPTSPVGEACRDPFVVRVTNDAEHPDGLFYMFFTARANSGPFDGRGVIGLARSTDLLHWEQLPPVTPIGLYHHLEVPQVLYLDGRYYLFFCTNAHSSARKTAHGIDAEWSGTHYLIADQLTGPYQPVDDPPLLADRNGTYYAGRVVDDPDGRPVFLAWRQWDVHGAFVGGISDPAPVHMMPDGRLRIDASQLWPDES